jgi:hypothetical protein
MMMRRGRSERVVEGVGQGWDDETRMKRTVTERLSSNVRHV